LTEISNDNVFVALASDGLQAYRQNLIRELTHNGFNVLQPVKSDIDRNGIGVMVSKCKTAIHLLSDRDFEHNASNLGLEEQQIDHAIEHSLVSNSSSDRSENKLKIYAWHLKLGSENAFVEQQLSSHLRKVQLNEEIELIRSNFEDFKHYLINQLTEDNLVVTKQTTLSGNRNYSIYFLHDASDLDSADLYKNQLTRLGFNVMMPSFNVNILKTRELHNEYLKKFDVAIVFAKNASINWINMKVMDVLKSPGLGRNKEILGKAIFTLNDNLDSILLRQRGFEFVSIDSGSVQLHTDKLLEKLDF